MKKVLAALSVCALFVSSAAFAEMKRLPKHTFGIGPEIYYIHYEEPIGRENIAEDNGVMYGLKVDYTNHNAYNWMLRLDTRFAWGAVDYNSQFSGGLNNISTFGLEIRPLIGYDFYRDVSEVIYTVYSGFGYRYWSDDSAGKVSSGGYYGYDRASNYFYLPVGIQARKDFTDGWVLDGNAEFDVLIKGIQRSDLGSVPGINNNITNNQNSGFGFRFSLKIMKKSKAIDIALEPFFRYWHIGRSNWSGVVENGTLSAQGVEPNNRTSEVGANLMFSY